MKILTDFCGGNADIISVEPDRVRFLPEIRDSMEDWFYWAFEVRGAAGQTVTFDMSPKRYVGYFGAAVSHDLEHWEWTHSALPDRSGFTYTFASDEDRVYFAHDMLYHPSQFHKFAELHGLRVRTLTADNKGTPIPYVRVGEGERTIILTARHHCCEATGDYIMEGIIDEYLRSPLEGCSILAIPFIDADGVVAGDQGKNRNPHDHNRDYLDEPLYNGVRAVQSLMRSERVLAVFDLHSPWHIGGRNDKVFIVRKLSEELESMKRFGKCLEAEITPGAMKYDSANDIDPGVDWNKCGPHISCGSYCGDFEGVELSFTLETTYFGEPGNIVSQDRLVETGRCFMRAINRYFGGRAPM